MHGEYSGIIAGLDTIVTIDSADRVVFPKPLRDGLRLTPGDTLALEFDGERTFEAFGVCSSPISPIKVPDGGGYTSGCSQTDHVGGGSGIGSPGVRRGCL